MPNQVSPNRAAIGACPLTATARLAIPVMAVLLAMTAPARADEPTAPGSATSSRDWVDTLLEPFEVLSHWLSGLFSHEERFVVDEVERFKRSVDSDLSAFDALVRQAGFRITAVSVGAGLVPQVSLSMEFLRRLSEPEKTALMARITDASRPVGTIERSIVMTLLNAAESVYAVRNDGFRLSGVDIDVDVIPNVTFVMSKSP